MFNGSLDLEKFWKAAAKLPWFKKWDKALVEPKNG